MRAPDLLRIGELGSNQAAATRKCTVSSFLGRLLGEQSQARKQTKRTARDVRCGVYGVYNAPQAMNPEHGARPRDQTGAAPRVSIGGAKMSSQLMPQRSDFPQTGLQGLRARMQDKTKLQRLDKFQVKKKRCLISVVSSLQQK